MKSRRDPQEPGLSNWLIVCLIAALLALPGIAYQVNPPPSDQEPPAEDSGGTGVPPPLPFGRRSPP